MKCTTYGCDGKGVVWDWASGQTFGCIECAARKMRKRSGMSVSELHAAFEENNKTLHGRCPEITCTKCGWVHMGAPRSYFERHVELNKIWYKQMTRSQRSEYKNIPTDKIENYVHCWCGGKDFRLAKEGDCPPGCTIGYLIYEPK